MDEAFWFKKLLLTSCVDLNLSLSNHQKLVFIADVHLSETHDEKTELFVEFLSEIDAETQAIFILGDLLNYFIALTQQKQ